MPAALVEKHIEVLKDARTRVEVRGEGLELAGLRFWTRRPADVARVLGKTSATVILLAHDPRRLTEASALNVPAVLSGHTHGGSGASRRRRGGPPPIPGLGGPGLEREHLDFRQPGDRNGLRSSQD